MITLLVSFFFLAGAAAFISAIPSQGDLSSYRELLSVTKEGGGAVKKKEARPYVTKQERSGVTKELLLSDGTEKLRFSISSQSSELSFHHQGGKVEVVEAMKEIDCWMQEELYYLLEDGRELFKEGDGPWRLKGGELLPEGTFSPIPMQTVQKIEAESGTYNYSRDLFIAQKAKVKRYRLAGHLLDKEAVEEGELLMAGNARELEWRLYNGKPQVKAHKLKAHFYSLEGGR